MLTNNALVPDTVVTEVKPQILSQRLFAGAGWALAGMTVNAIAAATASAIIAPLMAPGQVGAYFLAISISTVSVAVAQLGTEKILVRTIAEAIGTHSYGRARAAIAT